MEMKDSMELEKWSILQTVPTLKSGPPKNRGKEASL